MSFLIPREDSRVGLSKRNPLEDGNRATLGTLGLSEQNEIDNDKILRGSPSSSVINFYPRWCNCHCLSHKKYGKKEKVPCCKKCQNAFSCPPQGILSRFILFFFISGTFWFVCWSLDEFMAIDTISAVIILEITGLLFGILFKMIRLPSLLAPLILGIIFKNLPDVNFFHGLHSRGWIEPIREMALTIILTRAGIELSPKQMKKLKGIVPLAAFGPCLVEACACAGFFYAFFHDDGIDWRMCFVAGFALAAVSPAVVVPGLLSLKRRKFGEHEGVATLMVFFILSMTWNAYQIAASSIDDVLAISAFLIFLNLLTPGRAPWQTYSGGFLGLLIGALHGLIVGIILATVQAALAPLVKQEFAKTTETKLREHSQYVVMMAAFAILITAPLGAVLINLVGPYLLTQATDIPDEFPNGEGEPDEFDNVFVADSNISDEKINGSIDKMTIAVQENDDEAVIDASESRGTQDANRLREDNSQKPGVEKGK